MLRRRLMMMAQNLFNYIRIREKMVLGRKINGDGAPGEDIVSKRGLRFRRPLHFWHYPAKVFTEKRAVRTARKAAATPSPAESVRLARAMRMKRVNPDAYKVALIVARKLLQIGRKAAGEGAPGRWSRFRKVMQMGSWDDGERADGLPVRTRKALRLSRLNDGERADSMVTRARKAMRVARGISPDDHPGLPVKAGVRMQTGAELDPERAPGEVFHARKGISTGRKADAATWMEPVLLEDGSLLIRQAYHAELVDGELEVT